MIDIKTFVDSDVMISSFISNKGAAYLLINYEIPITLFVSNFSIKEIQNVSKRLKIKTSDITKIENNIKVINLGTSLESTNKDYEQYVFDINDAHVVAGTHKAKCKFLTTYNSKDYKIQKIKNDFGITVLTPGTLLQYLRGFDLI